MNHRSQRTSRSLWAGGLLLVTVAVLLLVPSIGPPAGRTDSSPFSSPRLATLSIPGSWTINGTVSKANLTITVGGSVFVNSGGALSLDNVTLLLTELPGVTNGISVRTGGSLSAKYFTFDSITGASGLWVQANSASTFHLWHGSIRDLGGGGATGHGVTIETASAIVDHVTFDHYGQALYVSGATNVQVTASRFLNFSSSSTSSYAVIVAGASAGFKLYDSTFQIPEDGGALSISSPNASVVGNAFSLDVGGSFAYPILFGYAGHGTPNAAGSQFLNNSVHGSGVIVQVASNVNISGNQVNDTGPNRPYGILAWVPVGTQAGTWMSGLRVENNVVSDYSRYGIRLQLNMTHFVVRGNLLKNPSPTPGPNWTLDPAGPQIDGIYVIRAANNGTVDHNVLQMYDGAKIATNGITLESRVNDVIVSDNQIYDASQNDIVLQGNAPNFDIGVHPWEKGPSLRDVISGNLFDTKQPIQQTNYEAKGVVIWLWANHSTVENNTFLGWNQVDTAFNYNGAAILTSASYGTFKDNTVEGARWGFVFTGYSGSASNPWPGEFNRSDNVVYGNQLSGITVGAVSETPTDGMGPLHNTLDVLDSTSTASGLPSMALESVDPATEITTAETQGTFALDMWTVNPVTSSSQVLDTWLPWTGLPPFEVATLGMKQSGSLYWGLTKLNSTSVTYVFPPTQTVLESVSLNVSAITYNASYEVTVSGAANGTYKFPVYSPNGPAQFTLPGGRNLTVTVRLLGWIAGGPPPKNETFPVTFSENGLPTGTSWGVGLGNASADGTAPAAINFERTNGTYPFEVLNVPGYLPTPGFGSLQVNGAGTNEAIGFEAVSAGYLATFSEAGLPSGTGWSVTIGQDTVGATAPSAVQFVLPNGTYAFSVAPVPGFDVSVPSDQITIDGAAALVAVTFTASGGGFGGQIHTVQGEVLDSSDSPVPSLSLTLVFGPPSAPGEWLNVSTDSHGRFSVSGLNLSGNLTAAQVHSTDYQVVDARLAWASSGTVNVTVFLESVSHPTGPGGVGALGGGGIPWMVLLPIGLAAAGMLACGAAAARTAVLGVRARRYRRYFDNRPQ